MKVKSLSRVLLFATPWTVAYQAPPSMVFSRQQCWSGLPFPSPGNLPDPGIEPGSPALAGRLYLLSQKGSPLSEEYMAETEEALKSLLMKVKEESEKAGLKLSIHRTKIMASGPITSW